MSASLPVGFTYVENAEDAAAFYNLNVILRQEATLKACMDLSLWLTLGELPCICTDELIAAYRHGHSQISASSCSRLQPLFILPFCIFQVQLCLSILD